MLVTNIGGREELRRVQGLLAGTDRRLQRDLAVEVRAAVAPIKREIPAEARVRMPNRYGLVLAAATRVTTRVTAGPTIRASIAVKAPGRRDERDVRALDAGTLRHPLFGDRSHWYRQRVRPGWVSDPVEWTRRRVVRGATRAVDQSADRIERG